MHTIKQKLSEHIIKYEELYYQYAIVKYLNDYLKKVSKDKIFYSHNIIAYNNYINFNINFCIDFCEFINYFIGEEHYMNPKKVLKNLYLDYTRNKTNKLTSKKLSKSIKKNICSNKKHTDPICECIRDYFINELKSLHEPTKQIRNSFCHKYQNIQANNKVEDYDNCMEQLFKILHDIKIVFDLNCKLVSHYDFLLKLTDKEIFYLEQIIDLIILGDIENFPFKSEYLHNTDFNKEIKINFYKKIHDNHDNLKYQYNNELFNVIEQSNPTEVAIFKFL